jgi:hypothetical protein
MNSNNNKEMVSGCRSQSVCPWISDGAFNEELGGEVLQHMESGGNLLNPPGTVWHHPYDNPDVMHLLRSSEHTTPTLQSTLHPDGIGGFGNYYGH